MKGESGKGKSIPALKDGKGAGGKTGAMATATISAIQKTAYSGPLPHPDDFAGYEKILPGSAERILAMAEREQESRICNNGKLLATQKRGQWMAFLLVFFMILAAVYLAVQGHGGVSIALITSAMVSVASVFIGRRKHRESA